MKLCRNWIINEVARTGEHTNERTNVRTYVLTYIRTGQTLYLSCGVVEGITNCFITNNYVFELIRKIIFTNYFSDFIHKATVIFRFRKALQKKCLHFDIIFRHYVKMPPVKF